VATSSSAKKVAKLASRGKGKKVRFQSGTTFPVIVAIVTAVMVALIVYSRATVPAVDSGPPQPGDAWSMAYGIKVCDQWLPNLTGTKAELAKDASTGDLTKVNTGNDADGIIHYHPQVGGATGRKARLGVFLDIYDVKLSDTKLELPKAQVGPGEQNVWDTANFKCNGKATQIRVRTWKDYTSSDFFDNVTAFRTLRFTNTGMVFSIAIVPKSDDIPQPDSASKLSSLGVVGNGTTTTTVPTGSTTPGTGSTTGTTTPGTGSTAGTTSPGTTSPGTAAPGTTVAPTTTG
jgi:hypothetical protein